MPKAKKPAKKPAALNPGHKYQIVGDSIVRLSDRAVIPHDLGNLDYLEFAAAAEAHPECVAE